MASKIFEVVADATLSGAPKHVLTLTQSLDKKKYQPKVICPEGWLSGECRRLGISVTTIAFTSSFFDLTSLDALRQLIKKEAPDLVHCHGLRAGWFGRRACLGLGVPLVYSEHLYTFDYHLASRGRELIQLRGLRAIANAAQAIVAPSLAVKRFLEQKIGVRPDKIQVVVNGLPARRIVSHPARGLKIGFIGGLNRQKGVADLIEAMKLLAPQYPKLKLEIIGTGPLEEALKIQAQSIRKQVKFLGQLNNIDPYLTNWRLMVIPSLSESFGQAALEAARASLPVVATSVGGLPDVVADNVTGRLVKPQSPKALAEVIAELLAKLQLARRLGQAGRVLFAKKFTARQMARKIEKIYEKLMAKKR